MAILENVLHGGISMNALRSILNACSAISAFSLFGVLVALIQRIIRKHQGGESAPIKEMLFPLLPSGGRYYSFFICVILPAAIIAGAWNIVMQRYFTKDEIGAFYESPEYIVDYSATIDLCGHSVFCIATIDHLYGDYWITQIQFPYGHIAYTGEEYYPYDETPSVLIGDMGWYCDITFNGKADGDAYERLLTEDLPDSGEFCASKESGIYHRLDCEYAKDIPMVNLIYLQNECEADAFGYVMCSECREREMNLVE